MFYSRNGEMLSPQLYYFITLFVSIGTVRRYGTIRLDYRTHRVLVNFNAASKTFLQIVCVSEPKKHTHAHRPTHTHSGVVKKTNCGVRFGSVQHRSDGDTHHNSHSYWTNCLINVFGQCFVWSCECERFARVNGKNSSVGLVHPKSFATALKNGT